MKELAKARGIKSVSAMKKSQVIEAMLAEDAREQQEKAGREQEEKQEIKPEEKTEERHEERHERENGEYRRNREIRESREPRENRSDRPPMDLAQLDSGVQVSGILEVMPDRIRVYPQRQLSSGGERCVCVSFPDTPVRPEDRGYYLRKYQD